MKVSGCCNCAVSFRRSAYGSLSADTSQMRQVMPSAVIDCAGLFLSFACILTLDVCVPSVGFETVSSGNPRRTTSCVGDGVGVGVGVI